MCHCPVHQAYEQPTTKGHMIPRRKILLTGSTGYVGGRLLPALLDDGHDVRCLVRSPKDARLDPRAKVTRGDLLGDPAALEEAMDGVDVAYYLEHSMGGDGDFAERDRRA